MPEELHSQLPCIKADQRVVDRKSQKLGIVSGISTMGWAVGVTSRRGSGSSRVNRNPQRSRGDDSKDASPSKRILESGSGETGFGDVTCVLVDFDYLTEVIFGEILK